MLLLSHENGVYRVKISKKDSVTGSNKTPVTLSFG